MQALGCNFCSKLKCTYCHVTSQYVLQLDFLIVDRVNNYSSRT